MACGRILERSLRPRVILEDLRGSRKSSRGSCLGRYLWGHWRDLRAFWRVLGGSWKGLGGP